MALELIQPLIEMSTRNLPGDIGRPVRKADNLTAICEPIVWKKQKTRRLTNLRASTACYRDSFKFFYQHNYPTFDMFYFTLHISTPTVESSIGITVFQNISLLNPCTLVLLNLDTYSCSHILNVLRIWIIRDNKFMNTKYTLLTNTAVYILFVVFTSFYFMYILIYCHVY
jgi:hypothetical protein